MMHIRLASTVIFKISNIDVQMCSYSGVIFLFHNTLV